MRIFEETLCKSDRPRGCTSPCAGRATFGPGRRGSDWRQTGHVGCFNMNLDQILNGDRSLKVKIYFHIETHSWLDHSVTIPVIARSREKSSMHAPWCRVRVKAAF